MCGLFGFCVPDAEQLSPALLARGRAALGALHHRGPDQQGEFVDGNLFLGHTRLSILDLSEAGAQPMVAAGQRTVLTINGEIYNHEALRAALSAARFRSGSDSEAALHGYEQFGLDGLLERMDGMYAGVIYDARARSLHLFRDRVGIKPLFLARARHEGQTIIAWASELNVLRRFLPTLTIDPTAIADFAAQRFIPAPKTLFREVEKLEPAHVVSISLEPLRFERRRYWSLTPETDTGSAAEQAARIREAVDASVAEQLMADVPVGVFLSGGIDSAIIAEAAVRQHQGLTAYTIGFEQASHDESQFAREFAQQLGLTHRCEVLTPDFDVALSAQMNDWYGEPFGDLSAFPTARLCQLARSGSTVALSGDGGDELFGGYRWYQRYQRYRRWNAWLRRAGNLDLPFRRPPANLVQKLLNRLALYCQFEPLQLYTALNSNLLSSELHELFQWLEIDRDYDPHWAMRRYFRPELGPLKALQYLDFHTWLPDDILTKVDRVSMRVSLEVRVPFLSRRLCELAFSLPESFLYRDGRLKGGLKFAYRGVLPEAVLERPKRGFSVPAHDWKHRVLEGQPGYVHYLLAALRRDGLEATL